MNFKSLAAELLTQARTLLPEWLPGGVFAGNEYQCASIAGGKGDSLKYNIKKGTGSDFASDDKFGDMINLYAKINGISQGEAFKRLGGRQEFDFSHKEFGKPIQTWAYSNEFIVARYNVGDGKQFIPWRLIDGKWKARFPDPRPLYGLDLLEQRPDAPVLIVEGEKTADAARAIAPSFVVVTWAGGAKSWQKTDWAPIYGRKAALWPDADKPGIEAMKGIAGVLAPHATEKTIKLLEVTGKSEGWDAADSGMAPTEFSEWCLKTPYFDTKSIPKSKPTKSPESQRVLHERLGLIMKTDDHPVCNAANVVRFLARHENYKGLIWFDDFYKNIFMMIDDAPTLWTEVMTINLLVLLQDVVGMDNLKKTMVEEGLLSVAHADIRNEPKDWLNSLVWDKNPRISEFFSVYMGAINSPYMLAASRNFWIGLVSRILDPGCQNDHMIVFEGKQNLGKTSTLRIIGGKWYAEMSESVQSKDFFLCLLGRIIVEIGELDSFNRAEVNRIKLIISASVDSYRAPFARRVEDHKRTCVLVGTTNDDTYLRDPSGARRFWPVMCGKIDLSKIKQDREQFFAEAVEAIKQNEEWHHMPTNETALIQELRRKKDPWEDILPSLLGVRSFVTIADCAALLGFTMDRLAGKDQDRIINALKKSNYKRDSRRIEGIVTRGWEFDPELQVTEELQHL